MIVKTTASVLGMIAIAASSFAYIDRLGLETGVGADVRTARMTVPDTNGLVAGSRVLLRGVPIGHVTGVDAAADRIEVSWTYDSDYEIPVDSSYRVDNLSALGETYLAVLPTTAAGPYLEDHATIPASRVAVPTSLQELSARLTRMLEQVEPDRVQDIFAAMNTALPDDTRVLGDLNKAGALLADTVVRQSGNLTVLLRAMQPLLLDSSWLPGDLAGVTPGVTRFARSFSDMIDGMHFAVEFGPLRDGIKYGAGPFLDEAQAFLDVTANDLNVLGVDLLPGVRAGAAAMRTVDVGHLLDNALASTASGDAVTVHVRLSGR